MADTKRYAIFHPISNEVHDIECPPGVTDARLHSWCVNSGYASGKLSFSGAALEAAKTRPSQAVLLVSHNGMHSIDAGGRIAKFFDRDSQKG